ncbi:MAG: radical SAM protein [Candidatus Riflebacteria bacterium]|nr:radical SAM protein [Candidatus Riflebacteria bacterium]
MKILLIDPPFRSFAGIFNMYFPLGPAYLAGALKQAGHVCKILDTDAAEGNDGEVDFTKEYDTYSHYIEALNNKEHPTWKVMGKIVFAEKPDVIGISAMTSKFGTAIQTARLCKRILPETPIIIGGPHATAMPELTMKLQEADYVLRGESEDSIVELIKAIEENKGFEKIRGLSWRNGSEIIHNPDRPFNKNLDSIPLPDREALMNPEAYTSEDMGVILTTRGCPYSCSYCFHMWNRTVRYRSVSSVINEIEETHRLFGTTHFSIKDDSFTVNKKHVKALCEAFNKLDFPITFSCTTRADIIDDELLSVMKKAGLIQLSIGIESGSPKVLQQTDKGINHKQILKASRLLNKHGIFWTGYFMIGLPEETEEDIIMTWRFLKRANPYFGGLGVYSPFPRTKLFTQAIEAGLLIADPPLEHFLTTNPKDLFFKDPSKRMIYISEDRFKALSAKAFRVFSRHNKNILNLARRALARRKLYFNDPGLLKRDLRKGLEFIGLKALPKLLGGNK